jgi:amino acid transporter
MGRPGYQQGVLSPSKLAEADNNGTALVTVAQVLGGGFWAKAMALSIALSVIATTGTGIVLGARIVYGMANYRVLPEFLGTMSRRYATPVASSVIVGLLQIPGRVKHESPHPRDTVTAPGP